MAVSTVPSQHQQQQQQQPQQPQQQQALALPPANGQMTSQMISIGDLLELAIKKTYRELTLLAELLPRKTDMERKIEIMRFANQNRQLYVRLLALVRWASTASKVEKCSQIVSFLDKQAMLFTETADNLARLSRETLVNARLPSFQILPAAEIMTLGTYSRLPLCIRDRLVPAKPIPNDEKREALLRLNHIIQQRLVTSQLPIEMRNIKIEFGRVTFDVPNEFNLTLTLMGDSDTLPWRVLNVTILVENRENSNVRELVMPIQLMYILNLIQAHLNESSRPLMEAYKILHSFCLSLQLEVLHYQSAHLYFERLREFLKIESYVPGSSIVLSYWRDQAEQSSSTSYRLIIEIDQQQPLKPLQIRHSPELHSKVFAKLVQANILSIEKILFYTIHERTRLKLETLRKMIEERASHLICELLPLPPVLHISFIEPSMPSERLLISVDALNGQFLAHIPQYDDCPHVTEIETWLNNTRSQNLDYILNTFGLLRIWITRERCRKTVETLPVTLLDSLPFAPTYKHSCLEKPGHKIYFQFTRHQNYCLMVVFDNDVRLTTVVMNFYLLNTKNVSIDSMTENSEQQTMAHNKETPKHYVTIIKGILLDRAQILQAFNDKQDLDRFAIVASDGLKRKLLMMDDDFSAKKRKHSGYYIAPLAHIISFCDEKLTFTFFIQELGKKQIQCQLVPDSDDHTFCMEIVKFPACSWCPTELTDAIQKQTLSATIRLIGKTTKLWNIYFRFADPPFQCLTIKESCLRKVVLKVLDDGPAPMSSSIDELLQDWTAIARLYDLVLKFDRELKASNRFNPSTIEVRWFTYKKITIAYGPTKSYFVSVYFKSADARFQLSFGVSDLGPSNSNPHNLIANELQKAFEKNRSILELLHVLSYTLQPLLTIQNIKAIPLLGVVSSKPFIPVLSFCVVPQSPTHVRLVYRNTYCLDIVMHSDNLVSIKDGALSQFDKTRAIEELYPIQGLKTFLNKFIDKHIFMRRISQTEDDNPPSPKSQIDGHDVCMFSGASIKTSPSKPSVQQQQQQNSNPLTPASPMTSMFNAHPNYANSPSTSNFALASPPSLAKQQQQVAPSPQMPTLDQSPAPFNINSPMNANLHAPSPSFLPAPSPSANQFIHSPAPGQFMSQNTPQPSESIGSPFNQPSLAMPSPANNPVWPASPSVARPSPRSMATSQPSPSMMAMPTYHPQAVNQFQPRVLPSKNWAAAIPTLLSHQGFENMCRPGSIDPMGSPYFNPYHSYSQLERFLGATFMRHHFQRQIEENFVVVAPIEQGSIIFKNEVMKFKLFIDQNMLSIHLWINSDMNQFSREELDILQKFFELKVGAPPYKPNAFITFSRMLNFPIRLLKDFIKIMKHELFPDRLQYKWQVQVLLTLPPQFTTAGMSACAYSKPNNKLLFHIQLTRNLANQMPDPAPLTIPLVYDSQANTIQMTRLDKTQNQAIALYSLVQNIINQIMNYNTNMECTIYLLVKELMTSLEFPITR